MIVDTVDSRDKKHTMPQGWKRPKELDCDLPGESFLSQRGYAIWKEGNDYLVDYLKQVLTVTPKVSPGAPTMAKPEPFSLYKENTKKLYIPRAFGMDWFGAPKVDRMSEGEPAPGLVFNGTLRAEQEVPVNSFLNACKDPTKRGGILSMQCAAGKCLARDTPVLMYDGSIKMVQDVVVGDVLMGDDSLPRNVLSTCTGQEMMYEVNPSKGTPYTVNKSHILSLVCHRKCALGNKGDIVDISVEDYLALPKSYHGTSSPLFGFRVGVEFEAQEVPLDPYEFGIWLTNGRCDSFPMILQLLQVLPCKHVPCFYKCNTRQVRLELLAGIIDHVGILRKSKTEFGYEVTIPDHVLMDDILYIARSLGFAAYKTTVEHRGDTYYRTLIHGANIHEIPVIIESNIIHDNEKPQAGTKNVLHVRITLKELAVDDYFGFEIDGNRRFLLGDFTVTHNTVMGLYIACALGRKTMVVCHKEFLLNQWKERIEQFVPKAKVGLIKAKVVDVEGKDIVLASLQSLAMKEYDPKLFEPFGFAIFDENHHLGAQVFSQALSKVSCKYILGLSATLNRKDGLRKVFEWFLGRPVYENKKREDRQMIIKMIPYRDALNPDYSKEILMWNGKKNVPQMINAICSYKPRNDLIIRELKALLQDPHRRVLILSDRRNHLKELEKRITNEKLASVGYYVGGMKEEELRESQTKHIVLATYVMAAEGMDIPHLNSLILASPVSAIEQPIGRIQRQKASERKCIPYTVDIWDQHSIFRGQGKRRCEFYLKNGYQVQGIEKVEEGSEETDCDTGDTEKGKTVEFQADSDED